MDFVADQRVNGQRFRILTVVDVYTREALAVEPAQRTGAEGVVAVCNKLTARIGAPRRVFVGNVLRQ